jgi:hypothetical protein
MLVIQSKGSLFFNLKYFLLKSGYINIVQFLLHVYIIYCPCIKLWIYFENHF